jgi:hypothetical protein
VRVVVIFCVLSLFVAEPALAQNAPPSSSSKPAPRAEAGARPTLLPDDGSLVGGTYHSDYFEFTYKVPAHLAMDREFMAGEQDLGKRMYVLLAAFGAASATRREGVVLTADRMAAPSSGAAGGPGGYLETVTRALEKQGAKRTGDVRKARFGGQQFWRADFVHNGENMGFQSVLVCARQGFTLAFDFVSPEEARTDELVESLQSLHFAGR